MYHFTPLDLLKTIQIKQGGIKCSLVELVTTAYHLLGHESTLLPLKKLQAIKVWSAALNQDVVNYLHYMHQYYLYLKSVLWHALGTTSWPLHLWKHQWICNVWKMLIWYHHHPSYNPASFHSGCFGPTKTSWMPWTDGDYMWNLG